MFLSRASVSVVYVSETIVACIFRTVVSKIHSSGPREEVGCCPLHGYRNVKVIFEGSYLPLNPDGFKVSFSVSPQFAMNSYLIII